MNMLNKTLKHPFLYAALLAAVPFLAVPARAEEATATPAATAEVVATAPEATEVATETKTSVEESTATPAEATVVEAPTPGYLTLALDEDAQATVVEVAVTTSKKVEHEAEDKSRDDVQATQAADKAPKPAQPKPKPGPRDDGDGD